jgi:hypothetical protein
MQSTTATVAQEAALLERKIALATEGFTTKFCELVLKDRNRMSQENALVLAEYIIAMKREVNPRLSYIRYTIQFLSELSKAIDKNKPFKDMTDIDTSIILIQPVNQKLRTHYTNGLAPIIRSA